jgi:GNAT superfamily N-acetyltransferase
VKNIEFRAVLPNEEVLIFSFLTIATRMQEASEPIQKAIFDSKIRKYWSNWGRSGDYGIVAIERISGLPVSCAWVRQFDKEEADRCFVGKNFPELATGTVESYRNQGIGKSTLETLIQNLHGKVPGICLSVRTDNPAVRLYEKLNFKRIPGSEWKNRIGTESFNMLLKL